MDKLILNAPFMTIVGFAVMVDQDQAAQNVDPELQSTLSALVKHY